ADPRPRGPHHRRGRRERRYRRGRRGGLRPRHRAGGPDRRREPVTLSTERGPKRGRAPFRRPPDSRPDTDSGHRMAFARLEHKYRVFLVCVAGIFITVFDTSSAIVALPTIALELDTDLPTAQWVIIGNGLIIAALLVPMGRLSDLIGRKRIYVLGSLAFAVGSVGAAVAGSIFGLDRQS